jgi:cytochrome c oxidase assembly factor CtaG
MTVVALCALGTLLFAQALVRLRRRGRPDLASLSRVPLFAGGIGIVLFALFGLDARADDDLTWHMAQHVLVGDLAPVVLVLATRGPLGVFLLPAPILAPLARSPLRTLVSVLLRPRVAYALWAANLATWHVPYLYDVAVRHERLHYVEHACWTVAGLLVWSVLLDERRGTGSRSPRRCSRRGRSSRTSSPSRSIIRSTRPTRACGSSSWRAW